MKAHLVQMDIAWEDRQSNFAIAERLIRQASPGSGDLIVLPEMFDSGFSLNVDRTADTERETADWIEQTAMSFGVLIQGARTIWGGPGHKARNIANIAGPTGPICEYAKIHPFGFGGESKLFDGGDTVVTYAWEETDQSMCVCPAICYDLRFPELFRKGLVAGAEVFAIGANWPCQRAAHWRALNIARAIENQAFVLGVNRCGSDPHLEYKGGTIAVGPRGDILGELGECEDVLSVEIRANEVRSWRSEFPAWQDMRL